MLELFELVFELLLELLFELVLELLFELVFELELLDELDDVLLANSSFVSASAAAGTWNGVARTGLTVLACAAPAPRTPAAMMVTVYFMSDDSIALVRPIIRAMHLLDSD